MRDKLRWLALPPALGLLLMFGPWRSAAPTPLEAPQAAASEPAAKPPSVAVPDFTRVLCTVVGVCLLGAAVVLGFARRRARAPGAGGAIVLRQSVRLSSRHTVHALEFAERLLLVGECEGSLSVLHAADDPELAAAARAKGAAPDDDDGAVLKDMVIPRPPQAGGPSTVPARSNKPPRGLADFRTLLGKTQVQA